MALDRVCSQLDGYFTGTTLYLAGCWASVFRTARVIPLQRLPWDVRTARSPQHNCSEKRQVL